MKKQFAAIALSLTFLIPLCACGVQNERTEGGAFAPMAPSDPVSPPETLPETFPEIFPETPEAPVPEPQAKTAKSTYILVKTDGLNVRAGAGTEFPSLGQAQKNTLLGYEGREGDWLKTVYRGKTAYVSAKKEYTDTMSMDCGSETVEKIISEGLKLLGTPYVYGAVRLTDGRGHFMKGFTTDAFDCSSLMQYIFYRGAGVELDVTTRTQILQGEETPREEIGRGDLLFFTNASRKNKTGIERVGHVALYLGGNYILHTASDFAKVEEISALRWSYFLTARRVTDRL